MKRKISGYKSFDAYETFDELGQFQTVMKMYRGSKYIGKVVIK